jgi:predicted nucleotidyltransferase
VVWETTARVYLFGSCARGEVWHGSDIDVAIDPDEDLPRSVMIGIRDALEESTVPYFVDVVGLKKADEQFKARVKAEGVLWIG